MEAHLPTNPFPSLSAVPGAGVSTPTHMAPHVALILLTTHMWGGHFSVGKSFSGQNLCFGAFGANIHCYTQQRAWHRSPFLNPPLFLWWASVPPSPPPPLGQLSGRHGYPPSPTSSAPVNAD